MNDATSATATASKRRTTISQGTLGGHVDSSSHAAGGEVTTDSGTGPPTPDVASRRRTMVANTKTSTSTSVSVEFVHSETGSGGGNNSIPASSSENSASPGASKPSTKKGLGAMSGKISKFKTAAKIVMGAEATPTERENEPGSSSNTGSGVQKNMVPPFLNFIRKNEKQYATDLGQVSIMLREAKGLFERVDKSLNELLEEEYKLLANPTLFEIQNSKSGKSNGGNPSHNQNTIDSIDGHKITSDVAAKVTGAGTTSEIEIQDEEMKTNATASATTTTTEAANTSSFKKGGLFKNLAKKAVKLGNSNTEAGEVTTPDAATIKSQQKPQLPPYLIETFKIAKSIKKEITDNASWLFDVDEAQQKKELTAAIRVHALQTMTDSYDNIAAEVAQQTEGVEPGLPETLDALRTNLRLQSKLQGGWKSLLYKLDGSVDYNLPLESYTETEKVDILKDMLAYARKETTMLQEKHEAARQPLLDEITRLQMEINEVKREAAETQTKMDALNREQMEKEIYDKARKDFLAENVEHHEFLMMKQAIVDATLLLHKLTAPDYDQLSQKKERIKTRQLNGTLPFDDEISDGDHGDDRNFGDHDDASAADMLSEASKSILEDYTHFDETHEAALSSTTAANIRPMTDMRINKSKSLSQFQPSPMFPPSTAAIATTNFPPGSFSFTKKVPIHDGALHPKYSNIKPHSAAGTNRPRARSPPLSGWRKVEQRARQARSMELLHKLNTPENSMDKHKLQPLTKGLAIAENILPPLPNSISISEGSGNNTMNVMTELRFKKSPVKEVETVTASDPVDKLLKLLKKKCRSVSRRILYVHKSEEDPSSWLLPQSNLANPLSHSVTDMPLSAGITTGAVNVDMEGGNDGLGIGEEGFEGVGQEPVGGAVNNNNNPPPFRTLYTGSTSTILSKQQRQAPYNVYQELLKISTPSTSERPKNTPGLSVAALAASSDIYARAELINKEINTHIEAAKLLEIELRGLRQTYTTGAAVRGGSAKKMTAERGQSRVGSRGIL